MTSFANHNPIDAPAGFELSAAQLYAYWVEIHPDDGRLPGRQHFDAAELGSRHPSLLQHLWLADVEPNPLRFRLRLIGSAVYMTSPFARAGHYVDEFIDPATRTETLQNTFTRLVETGMPDFRRGRPQPVIRPHGGRQIRELSRLSLPLASDGRTVDMILNVTSCALLSAAEPAAIRRSA